MEYTVRNARGALLGRKVLPSHRGADVSLEKDELFRLDNSRHSQSIQVVEGRVWLTQSGNPEDVILEKGQVYRVTGGGGVVIQGLPAGRVRFV